MAADGLTTIRSNYGPKDTMNRLEAEVESKRHDRVSRTSIMQQERARLVGTAAADGPPGYSAMRRGARRSCSRCRL